MSTFFRLLSTSLSYPLGLLCLILTYKYVHAVQATKLQHFYELTNFYLFFFVTPLHFTHLFVTLHRFFEQS